jgi:prolyl-tRNA synthetase
MNKSDAVRSATEALYVACDAAGLSVFMDDRPERPGVKFAEMELLGMPVRATIGERSLADGLLEITRRSDGKTEMVAPDAALDQIRRFLQER